MSNKNDAGGSKDMPDNFPAEDLVLKSSIIRAELKTGHNTYRIIPIRLKDRNADEFLWQTA